MRRTNRVYGGTENSPGLASLRLASLCFTSPNVEYTSEVTLTAYLPAILRLALVPCSFAPGTLVYPHSAFYHDTESQKRQ